MAIPTGAGGERRFACTQCGACCDRSPEVALSEAGALADVFVFRLMFRLYELPRNFAGTLETRSTAGSAERFYESKRLLSAFAARKSPSKRYVGTKAVEYVRYLTISALTLDGGTGACSALSKGRCGIYERRPLACRTLPFHYSRAEAGIEQDLDAFVATEGYACDTSASAPVVLKDGRIIGQDWRRYRSDALQRAERDRPWQDAILRQLKSHARNRALPSLREIEAGAAYGATTTSMRAAWQIAADAGLITSDASRAFVQAQAAVIERSLIAPNGTPAWRETLSEMRDEYRSALAGRS